VAHCYDHCDVEHELATHTSVVVRGLPLIAARRLLPVVLTCLAIGVTALVVLVPYGNRTEPKLSYDTPYYVWRTALVADHGLDALRWIPEGAVPNPDRPGFPTLGAILGAIVGLEPLVLSIIVRAVAAVAIGLAAGAMAKESLQEPTWAFPAFVIGLGTSAAVLGTAVGSLDHLLADVMLMAIVAVVPATASGNRGVVGAAALLAAAAITHWFVTGLFLGLFLTTAAGLFLLPSSSGPQGDHRSPDPARRLLAVAGILGLTAVLALALIPALPDSLPGLAGGKGNPTRLSFYELPILLPLATLGLVVTLRSGRGTARLASGLLLGVWAAVVPAAMLASAIMSTPLKLFRVAPFALGVPVLATLALIGIARLSWRRFGPIGALIGATVLIGGLLWSAGSPIATFAEASGSLVSTKLEQTRTAGRYLAEVAEPGHPVIFVSVTDPRLIDRVARAGVPSRNIVDTWVFVGNLEDFEAQTPPSDPARPRLSAVAQRWWAASWPHPDDVFRRDPIVIQLTNPERSSPATRVELAPGTILIRGPEPGRWFEPAPPLRFSRFELLASTALALLVLAIVGGGWAGALLDVSAPSVVALAPASGAAALILGGLLADRLGVPLAGPPGAVVAAIVALLGWWLFAAPLFRGWRRDRDHASSRIRRRGS
jgi:MFS family permease